MKISLALHEVWVLSEVVDTTTYQLLYLLQLSACKPNEWFIKQ